ncbi:hypothetical protein BC830DRAFT_1167951 [Chytriomyces sp. MP71]|nr:hypothetical protein BC830DRAFT_1167951 [Chytriomyces sp. MP71]
MALSAGTNPSNHRSSMALSNNTNDTFRRRIVKSGKVAPEPNISQSMKSVDFANHDFSLNTLLVDGMSYLDSSTGEEDHYVDEMDIGPPSFKALPDFTTKQFRAKYVAMFCFVTLFTLTIAVLMYDFVSLGFGIDVVDGVTFKSSR